MKIATALTLTAILLVGCGGQSGTGPVSETSAPNDASVDVIQAALDEQTAEAGCASCIYKMDGIKGCVTAVKVGNTPMILTGVEVDAHELGLCTASKQILVSGKVEGGNFVATKVELQ